MAKLSILLIDDEESQVISLKTFLQKRSYEIFSSTEVSKALDIIDKNVIDIVLSDFRMPEMDGFSLMQKVKSMNPSIDFVIMTAYGNVEDAVKIMKTGAYDFLTKPIDLDLLEKLLERIKEKRNLISENKQLREQIEEKFKFEKIISQSPQMEEVLSTASRAAKSNATVIILGESGTGKELIAKALHHTSERKEKQFVTVNVASLSETLIESELFGHEKGSFTGAINTRIGRFEEADGGNLFIDEVGDIPLSAQVKLLRAIQFGEIQKIGSNTVTKVNVRIIAATHRNLEEMIKNGSFREDLYYRLNVISIKLPPLRNRKVDLPALINHFIKKYSDENKKMIGGISREAMDKLMKYDFPGNVRELENIIERAVVMCRDEIISVQDLPPIVENYSYQKILDAHDLSNSYEEKVEEFERAMIKEALSQTNGNQSAAARLLNITERHLRSRLQRLKLK